MQFTHSSSFAFLFLCLFQTTPTDSHKHTHRQKSRTHPPTKETQSSPWKKLIEAWNQETKYSPIKGFLKNCHYRQRAWNEGTYLKYIARSVDRIACSSILMARLYSSGDSDWKMLLPCNPPKNVIDWGWLAACPAPTPPHHFSTVSGVNKPWELPYLAV